MTAIYMRHEHAAADVAHHGRRAPRRTPLVNAAAAKPQVLHKGTRRVSAEGGAT